MSTKKYADFIAEQQRKLRGAGLVREYIELGKGENPKVAEKIADKYGNDPIHVHSEGSSHVYQVEMDSEEEGTNFVHHDEKTGKTKEFNIPEGKKSLKQTQKLVPPAASHAVREIMKTHNEMQFDDE